jgi:hypothetical protein
VKLISNSNLRTQSTPFEMKMEPILAQKPWQYNLFANEFNNLYLLMDNKK